MAGWTDIQRLRYLVEEAAGCLTICTHDELGGARAGLGLPDPPRQAEPGSEQGLSKRERIKWSLARLTDEDVPVVAGRMLDGWLPKSLDAATRNAIQGVLWAGQGALEIPRRTRPRYRPRPRP